MSELKVFTKEQLKAELTRRHNEDYEVVVVLHTPEWREGKYDIEATHTRYFDPKDYETGKGLDGKSTILDILRIKVVDGKMKIVETSDSEKMRTP